MGQDLHRPREKPTDLPRRRPGMVAAFGQPLSERKTVRTLDLEGESILLSKVDCSYRRTLERLLNEPGVANENVHIFHSVEALKRCVIKGAGITILSEVAVRENPAGGRPRCLELGGAGVRRGPHHDLVRRAMALSGPRGLHGDDPRRPQGVLRRFMTDWHFRAPCPHWLKGANNG
jgi:DNA-binding transcriptional LysR family regulator